MGGNGVLPPPVTYVMWSPWHPEIGLPIVLACLSCTLPTAYSLPGTSHHLAEADAFTNLLGEVLSKKWQVYAQPPFGQPKQVLDYLGRYVHRFAFSNGRLLAISAGQVHFTYRDYQANGVQKR